MRYQVSASHLNGDAHGHLVGGLPRMQLELLAVAEEHQRVALVDQPDVAALAALLAAAHVGFDRVAGQSGRPDRTPSRGGRRCRRAAASSTLPTPSTVRWNTLVGRAVHHAGGASPAAFSKSNVHGSGAITRTRAWPVTPPTVALTNPAVDPAGGVDAVGVDRALS